MSTVDANRVIFTGENSAIRLSNNDSDSFATNATFWRAGADKYLGMAGPPWQPADGRLNQSSSAAWRSGE